MIIIKMRKILKKQYRRKEEGKTDYRKRLRLLMSRKSRAVVRRANNNITIQIVNYEDAGDKILAGANSRTLLKQYGWKAHKGNIPAAYLTGLMCGKKAVANGVKEAILDLGFQKPQQKGIIYASLKGLVDGGLNIPHSKEILPEEDVIKGKKIEDYANKLKENADAYKKQFSNYIKNNIKPEEITKHFEEVKNKIIKG